MAKKPKLDGTLLGRGARKVAPKLRMIANGSPRVNAARAQFCACLAVKGPSAPAERKPTLAAQRRPVSTVKSRRGHLNALAPNVLTSVFVRVAPGTRRRIPGEQGRMGDLRMARMTLAQLRTEANRDDVAQIEAAESLSDPRPLRAATTKAPKSRKIRSRRPHRDGKEVLIGIVDVGGFDFAHPDFLDRQGRTRFARIWDQGGNTRPSPKGAPFRYGAEIQRKHMNAAIKASASDGLPATELEPQSQMTAGSHGTHVASIAAGNHGVCPEATIAAVLVSLPASDWERRSSFYDSTRLVHAVEYLLQVAKEEGCKAVVINVSLGTNGHAHDGSSPLCRWIDAQLAIPGRAVCVAAGNAGQESAEHPDDLGWIMGRIHTSGTVASRGLTRDLEWVVVGDGRVDVSENELEIWYSAQDRFAVSVRPPGSNRWIGPVKPRQFIENRRLPDGSFISIYNELFHAANGANHISIYLSPFLGDDKGVVGVPKGVWVVRLEGIEVKNGEFHAWIERDDPRPLGRAGDRELWNFPSFFSESSYVDACSVSTLACGHRIVSVGNLDLRRNRINPSSSQGPTRDGRCKPDIAAPGTDIVAANGFAGPRDLWISMTGTSMASPYVAGVIGLMLAVEPRLTAAQIEGILHRTARPLPGADHRWINDAGYGEIDPDACLEEAATLFDREDRT